MNSVFALQLVELDLSQLMIAILIHFHFLIQGRILAEKYRCKQTCKVRKVLRHRWSYNYGKKVKDIKMFNQKSPFIFGWTLYNSSVIRQRGESQNGGNKKTNHAKLSEKRIFLPRDTHTFYLRFEIRPFALLPRNCGIKWKE